MANMMFHGSLDNMAKRGSQVMSTSSPCQCCCHEHTGAGHQHQHTPMITVARNVTGHVSHRGERMQLPESSPHSRSMSPRSRSLGPRRRGLGAVSPPRQMSMSPTAELESSATFPQASYLDTNVDLSLPIPLSSSQIFPPSNEHHISSKSGDSMHKQSLAHSHPPPQSFEENMDDRRSQISQPPPSARTVEHLHYPLQLLPSPIGEEACMNCKLLEHQLSEKTLELGYFRQRKSLLESQIEALHQQLEGWEEKSSFKVEQKLKEEVKLLMRERHLWEDIVKRASEMGLYERKVLLEMQTAISRFIEYDRKESQMRLKEDRHLIASLQETLHQERKLRQDVVSETEVRLISENADLLSTLRAKETALMEEIAKNEKSSVEVRKLERQVKELENMAVQNISWQLIADALDVEEKEILSSAWCDLPSELKEKLNSTETIREYLQESEFLDVTDDIIQCLWYRFRCTQKAYNALKQRLEHLGISKEDDWQTLGEIDDLLFSKDRDITSLKEEVAIFRRKCEELKLNFQQKLEAALFERNKLQLQLDQMQKPFSVGDVPRSQEQEVKSEYAHYLQQTYVSLQKAFDFMESSAANHQLKRKLELLQTALDSTASSQSITTSVDELLNIDSIDHLRQKCLLLFNANRELMSSQKELEQKRKDTFSPDSGEQYRTSLMEYKLEAAEEAHRLKLKERDAWISSLENKVRDLEILNDDLKSRLERERKDRERSIVDRNVDLQLHSRYGSYLSVTHNEPLWQEERKHDKGRASRDFPEEIPSKEGGILKSPIKHSVKQKSERSDFHEDPRQKLLRSHDGRKSNHPETVDNILIPHLEGESLSVKLLEDKFIFMKLRKCSSLVEAAVKELLTEVEILEKHSVLDLSRLRNSASNLRVYLDDERNHLYDDLRRMLDELRHEKERSQTLSEKKKELQTSFEELRRRFGAPVPRAGAVVDTDLTDVEDIRKVKEALENSQKLIKNLKKRHLEEKQNLNTRITYYVENEKVISHTLEKLREEASYLEKQVTLLKQENERLATESNEHEKILWRERESYDRQLDGLRSSFDDLQREFKVKCNEALHLQEELMAMKVESRSLQSEITSLNYKLTGEQNTLKQITGKMMDMSSQLSTSKRRLANQKDELERVSSYRRRVKELNQVRTQTETDLKCVLTEKDHLAQQLEWMKERWSDLERQLQQEKAAHITLKARNEGMEEEIEWLRSQLQHVKSRCNLEAQIHDPKTRADLIQTLIHQSHSKAQVLLQTDVELPLIQSCRNGSKEEEKT